MSRRATPTAAQRALFIAAAAILTIWQYLAGRVQLPTRYTTSYWLISWDHGFVRRGLAGELNQALFPGELGAGAMTLSLASGVMAAAAIATVAWVLVLRGDWAGAWFGLLILASSGTLKATLFFSRPEMIALWSLVGVGLATRIAAERLRWAMLLGSGAFLAVVGLIQEASLMQVLPWALLLIVTARGRRSLLEATLFAALPSLVMALVVLRGVATKRQVAALRADTMQWLGESKSGNAASFLGYSMGRAMKSVLSLGMPSLLTMALTALVVFVLLPLLAYRLAGIDLVRIFRTPAGAACLVLLVAPAFIVQLATGFDWLRWFATWACLWTLTGALIVLRGDEKAPGPVRDPGPFPHRRSVLLVLVLLALTAIPAGPAVGRRECGYTWIGTQMSNTVSSLHDRVNRVPLTQGQDFDPACPKEP